MSLFYVLFPCWSLNVHFVILLAAVVQSNRDRKFKSASVANSAVKTKYLPAQLFSPSQRMPFPRLKVSERGPPALWAGARCTFSLFRAIFYRALRIFLHIGCVNLGEAVTFFADSFKRNNFLIQFKLLKIFWGTKISFLPAVSHVISEIDNNCPLNCPKF